MLYDIVFLIFVAIGFWWGYSKGIIYSLFSLASYFIGIIGAIKFSYIPVKFLSHSLNLGTTGIGILAFIIVFILTVMLIRLVAWALEKILQSFSLNLINQLVGGCIYALISIYSLCVFIWFLNKTDIVGQNQKRESHVYGYINEIAPAVIDFTAKAIPVVKTTFYNYEELIKQTAQENQHSPEK